MTVFEDRLDAVRDYLQDMRCTVVLDEPFGNGSGHQIKTMRNGSKGPVVNLYHTGTHHVGGQQIDDIRPETAQLLNGSQGIAALSRKVFVVYGHDRAARDQLEAMLRKWRLEPLILEDLPLAGQTIIEKLEQYQNDASYAVTLATPDDEGHPKDRPNEKALRARQNVVLELGMMLAKLGRDRVAILIPSSTSMEKPSDSNGLLYIPYVTKVQEVQV